MSFSNCLFARRISFFTLLRTFVYAVLCSFALLLLIQALCRGSFSQINFRTSMLTGTLPFNFQNGASFDDVGTNFSRSWWIFALKMFHNTLRTSVFICKKFIFPICLLKVSNHQSVVPLVVLYFVDGFSSSCSQTNLNNKTAWSLFPSGGR